MNKLIIICMLALTVTGCGRKGPLINPDAFQTPPVKDLQVVQQGDHLTVSWSKPPAPATKKQQDDVAGFKILRREILPPNLDCEDCVDAYRVFKTVDLEFMKNAIFKNGRYIITDNEPTPGKSYQYKIVSILKSGASSLDSNKTRIKVLPIAPAPTLKLTPSPISIVLEWTAPVLPPTMVLQGYNIYRSEVGKEPALQPLNAKPFNGTQYEDIKVLRGISYRYTVRAVITIDKDTAESAPSNEMTSTVSPPEF